MNYTDKNKELEQYLKEELKESRYLHSMGVEKMARHLAELHGADADKAAWAGRYHDIAKCLSKDKMNNYVREYRLSDIYYDNPAIAHSKVGACILKYEFGVTDEDILAAVASHTTGRRDMSLLEEIVYVSDAIEETRHYPEIEGLRRQAEVDLDGACLFIMDYTIDLIRSQGRFLDDDTLEARAFIAERIESNKEY